MSTNIQSPFTGGGIPGGAAGGGLTGTYPNPGLSAASIAASQNWPWLPADNGLLAASYDISNLGQATAVFVAGVLYLSKIQIRSAITATNIWFLVSTAGVGASTGSFAGLYSSAGSLLSGSSDTAAQFQGTGAQSVALTSAQALAAGTFVWGAFLSNLATSQPALRCGPAPSAGILNLNLTAANFRAASSGSGQTTLPASFTPSALTGSAIGSAWAGIN